MVTVPKYLPEVPALRKNPVFLYASDRFMKPYPFQADIAVGIDSVIDKKLQVLLGMVSQFYEGGVSGSAEMMPSDPEKQKARWAALKEGFAERSRGIADRFRPGLEAWYGRDRAAGFKYAEAFEICEYGRRPDRAEIRKLFPFFD